MDKVSPQKRSQIMASVHSKDTRPEIALRKALWQAGVRGYRLDRDLLGRPDLTFKAHRVAVFVDGCFWHGCPKCYRQPTNNKDYWIVKIANNRKRDRQVSEKLASQGWTVVRLWEHEIRENTQRCIERIKQALGH